ncbi:MAG: helix-turn-helix transcriptional regulator [Blastocatellia bacterium]
MSNKKNKLTKLDELKLFDLEKEDLDFPSICKFIRKTFNVTQQQMAQKLGISLTAYGYWEYGKRVPKSWQALNLGLMYVYAKEYAAENCSVTNDSSQEENPQNQAA